MAVRRGEGECSPLAVGGLQPTGSASRALDRFGQIVEGRLGLGAKRCVPEARLGRLGDDDAVNVGVLVGAKEDGPTFRVCDLHAKEVDEELERRLGLRAQHLDVSKLRALGWQARTPLADGLRATYDWYRTHGQRRS